MNNFEDTKFNDLTNQQLDEMTETQVVNKALSEYVQEINNHVKAINKCANHAVGFLLITLASIAPFGLYALLALIPTLFFVYYIFMFKKSVVWHVRSFKSTASMYNSLGFCDLVSVHENNISKNVIIGDFYKLN
jgi:predicted PurR-regulated permease PerM